MIRMISGLFFLASLVVSCQRELQFDDPAINNPAPPAAGGNASGYFMRAKVDGSQRTFNFSNAAIISDLGTGGKNITFIGLASQSSSSLEGLHLSIYFLTGNPATGTFVQDDLTSQYVLTGDYNANSLQVGYFAGLHTPSVLPFKITITTLSNTVVKGSFEGAFYKKDLQSGPGSPNEYVLLREGEFSLPVK